MRNLLPLSFLLVLTGLLPVSAQPRGEAIPSVPDINGMAVSLVKPAFPETAVAADADGEAVIVRVVVDENGSVVRAECSTGCHVMLKDAAELAALQSKFKPLVIEGRAVKYQGTLHYTFVVSRVDWLRFATALESVRQFDNLSLGPVAQILSANLEKEKASLLALDAKGVDFDTRQKVIAEVDASIRSRLKGPDLWRYDLGMAFRRVSFWPQAAERIDRDKLQRALEGLAGVVSTAPEGTSSALLSELATLSKYRVPDGVAEGDLRKAIADLSRNVMRQLAGPPPAPRQH